MELLRKINHLRDSWLVLRNDGLQTGFSWAILDSFFYAHSAIVDSFVIILFILRNITFRTVIVDQEAKFVVV